MPEKAILVGIAVQKGDARGRAPDHAGDNPEESLMELAVLVESAGAEVLECLLQNRDQALASTLIGSGKVEEVAGLVAAYGAHLVVFDSELTPTQQRNLENALDCRVLDRTQLILDIFARRARTREGQLQVELAQLNYMLPRLAGQGTKLSRLGGGIGTRGPGETKLETDRRRIFRRIRKIEADIENVRAGRGVQRKQRQEVPLATVALVGYTNAGKSSLFNRLTGAGVMADARMFATLDPTVRHTLLPSRRKVLLSDTVGFIRRLPTTLVQAFRATLEEVVEASLLLHVLDVSSPQATEHTAQVLRVLTELGVESTPQILVLNKVDLLDGAGEDPMSVARRVLGDATEGPVLAAAVSARTGEGVEALLRMVDEQLVLDPVEPVFLRVPVGEGGVLHLLHEHGRVLRSEYGATHCEVEAEVPRSLVRRLKPFLALHPSADTAPVA
ncbi:MAG: GTPase HflX [Acidobacteria bacterium]|nr:GTPase HflX [Acidobacteriota bacterium]